MPIEIFIWLFAVLIGFWVAYQYNVEIRKGKGARFPSALIGVGVDPPVGFDGFVLFKKQLVLNIS